MQPADRAFRRFILGTAGGVLGFFIVLAILTSGPRGAREDAERSIRRNSRDLRDSRYSSTQVSELQQRLGDLEQRNVALAARTLPPVREQFRLPPGVPASQHYIRTTGAPQVQ